MQKIKIGDQVMWRGAWGTEEVKLATLTRIELCEEERMKSGEAVQEVDEKDLRRCVVGLDNGHWAYGFQLTPAA